MRVILSYLLNASLFFQQFQSIYLKNDKLNNKLEHYLIYLGNSLTRYTYEDL